MTGMDGDARSAWVPPYGDDPVEPQWMGHWSSADHPGFVQEVDLNARAGSEWEWRHRRKTYTGEPVEPWRPGPAPRKPERPNAEEDAE